jgi:hypothetical protein
MVEVIGQSAPIPYVEARVGISIKVCCFFGMGVKCFYAVFLGGQMLFFLAGLIVPLRSPIVSVTARCGPHGP